MGSRSPVRTSNCVDRANCSELVRRGWHSCAWPISFVTRTYCRVSRRRPSCCWPPTRIIFRRLRCAGWGRLNGMVGSADPLGYLMAAVSPDFSLRPAKSGEAPFFHRLSRRIEEYSQLARFNRPAGTWLLLWPALWALWIAGEGQPNPKVLIVFVLGVVVMRAAGCVINDFADRDIDIHVRRTRDRPIAARRVSPVE